MRGRMAWLAAGVALAGSAAALGAALTGTQVGDGLAAIWKGLILLLAMVLIVSRVLARPTVTVQSIYGALSAYVLIGMMFAAFYAAIKYLDGEGFFANGQPGEHPDVPVFQLHHLDHSGLRGLYRCQQRRPGRGGPGGDDRPDIPGHPGGAPRLRLPGAAI